MQTYNSSLNDFIASVNILCENQLPHQNSLILLMSNIDNLESLDLVKLNTIFLNTIDLQMNQTIALSAQASRIFTLSNTVNSLVGSDSSLQTRITSLKAIDTTMNANLVTINTNLVNLKSDLENIIKPKSLQIQSEIESFTSNITSVNFRINKLITAQTSIENLLSNINIENADFNTAYISLNNATNILTSSITSNNSLLLGEQGTSTAHKNNISSIAGQVLSVKSIYLGLNNQAATLEYLLTDMNTRIANIESGNNPTLSAQVELIETDLQDKIATFISSESDTALISQNNEESYNALMQISENTANADNLNTAVLDNLNVESLNYTTLIKEYNKISQLVSILPPQCSIHSIIGVTRKSFIVKLNVLSMGSESLAYLYLKYKKNTDSAWITSTKIKISVAGIYQFAINNLEKLSYYQVYGLIDGLTNINNNSLSTQQSVGTSGESAYDTSTAANFIGISPTSSSVQIDSSTFPILVNASITAGIIKASGTPALATTLNIMQQSGEADFTSSSSTTQVRINNYFIPLQSTLSSISILNYIGNEITSADNLIIDDNGTLIQRSISSVVNSVGSNLVQVQSAPNNILTFNINNTDAGQYAACFNWNSKSFSILKWTSSGFRNISTTTTAENVQDAITFKIGSSVYIITAQGQNKLIGYRWNGNTAGNMFDIFTTITGFSAITSIAYHFDGTYHNIIVCRDGFVNALVYRWNGSNFLYSYDMTPPASNPGQKFIAVYAWSGTYVAAVLHSSGLLCFIKYNNSTKQFESTAFYQYILNQPTTGAFLEKSGVLYFVASDLNTQKINLFSITSGWATNCIQSLYVSNLYPGIGIGNGIGSNNTQAIFINCLGSVKEFTLVNEQLYQTNKYFGRLGDEAYTSNRLDVLTLAGKKYLLTCDQRNNNIEILSNSNVKKISPFNMIDSTSNSATHDAETFLIGSDRYFAITNFSASTIQLFKDNGNNTYALIQTINSTSNSALLDITSFISNGNNYLAVCAGNRNQLDLYKWNGTSFALYSQIASGIYPHSCKSVNISGTNYIVVGTITGGAIQIFKFDNATTTLSNVSTFTLPASTLQFDFCIIGADVYLLIGQSGGGLYIRKWNGTSFAAHASYSGVNYKLTALSANISSNVYVATSDNTGIIIYRYDGTSLTQVASVISDVGERSFALLNGSVLHLYFAGNAYLNEVREYTFDGTSLRLSGINSTVKWPYGLAGYINNYGENVIIVPGMTDRKVGIHKDDYNSLENSALIQTINLSSNLSNRAIFLCKGLRSLETSCVASGSPSFTANTLSSIKRTNNILTFKYADLALSGRNLQYRITMSKNDELIQLFSNVSN